MYRYRLYIDCIQTVYIYVCVYNTRAWSVVGLLN